MPAAVTFAAIGTFVADVVIPFLIRAAITTAISSIGSKKPRSKQ